MARAALDRELPIGVRARTTSTPGAEASRASRRGALLALALALALLVPATASAGRLQVDLRDCPCRNSARLAARLESALETPMAARSDRALRLTRLGAGTLHVALSGDTGTYESDIAFRPEDCGELGETLRLLVASWLESEPATPPEIVEAPAPAPPPTEPAAAAAAPMPRSFSVGVGLGAASEMEPRRAVPAATLGVELRLSAVFGAGLGVLYQAPATVPVDEGRLRLESFAVVAPLRVRLGLAAGLDLDLLAGPALRVSRFESQGFDRNFSRSFADFAVVASPRLRLEVAARWSLVAAVEALARPRTDRLLFAGTGAFVRVSSILLRAGVGVAWEAF